MGRRLLQRMAVGLSVTLCATVLALSAAGPADAATSVTALSIVVATRTAGAPAAIYHVTFTTHSALVAGSGTISLTAPAGTVFPSAPSAYMVATGTSGGAVTVAPSVGSGGAAVTVTVPVAVTAADTVGLAIEGVTNTSAVGLQSVTAKTSADTAPVSTTFTTVAPGPAQAARVVVSPQTAGATDVALAIALTGSATGQLGARSTITLGGPAGTVFPASGYAVSYPDGEGFSTVTPAAAVSNGGATVTLSGVLAARAQTTSERVVVTGVHAPATAGPMHVDVATSSDPVAIAAPFAVVAAPVSPQGLTMSSSTPTPSATGVTFSIDLTASGSGGLVGTYQGSAVKPGLSKVTLQAPAGTTFPTSACSYVLQDLTTPNSSVVSGCGTSNGGVSTSAAGVQLVPPFDVAPGDHVRLTIQGGTNPPSKGSGQLAVSDTSDSVPAHVAFPLTVGSGTPQDVAVAPRSTAAGVAPVRYAVRFTASATGGLAAGSTITIAGPAVAGFPTLAAAYQVSNLTTGGGTHCSGACTGNVVTGSGPSVTLVSPITISAGDQVQVDVFPVTNQPTPGLQQLTVATAADTTPAAASFTLVTPAALSGPTVELSSATPAGTATYTLDAATSASGGLSGYGSAPGSAASTVTIAAPSGTTFPSDGCRYAVTDVTTSNSASACGAPIALANGGATAAVPVPIDVPSGHQLRVTIAGATNPGAVGVQAVTVRTSSDPGLVTAPYVDVVRGTVRDQAAKPLAGAIVQACRASSGCVVSQATLSDGAYAVVLGRDGAGDWTLTGAARPLGSFSSFQPVIRMVTVGTAPTLTGVDFVLQAEAPVPPEVTLGGTHGTVPVLYWGSGYPLTIASCPNGVAFVTITGIDQRNGHNALMVQRLPEKPTGSGTYAGTIGPFEPLHGDVSVDYRVDCQPGSAVTPSTGPARGGGQVRLTGKGFLGATSVMFGTAAASAYTVVSDDEIVATPPAGSGTVMVQVTDPHGTTPAMPSAKYTYVRVDGVSPAAATPGTGVTISGHGLATAAALYFGGAVASTWTVVSDTTITATVPADADLSDIAVITEDGGVSSGPLSTSAPTPAPAAPAAGAPRSTRLGPETFFSDATDRWLKTGDLAASIADRALTNCSANKGNVEKAVGDAIRQAIDEQINKLRDDPNAAVALFTAPFIDTVVGFAVAAVALYAGAPVGALLGIIALILALPSILQTLEKLFKNPHAQKCFDNVVKNFFPKPPKSKGKKPKGHFNVKIDPSGTIVDTNGNPVSGATVTIFRSDTPTGPLTPVPAESVLLEPAVNPETTVGDGIFHWDVYAGYYQVRAEKAGCTVPGHPNQTVATTAVLPVPPPQVGLVLTLACPGSPPAPKPTVTSVERPFGRPGGGDTISVAGSGFTRAATVHVGSTSATATFVSTTLLRVITPAGTGQAPVTVSTAGGTSTPSAAALFSYIALPAVTSISPTSGPAAGGTVVHITGSGFTPTSLVAFGARPAAAQTYVSATKVDAVAPAGAGLLDVTVSNRVGNSPPVPADRFSSRSTTEHEALVIAAYHDFLGRAPTTTELTTRVAELDTGHLTQHGLMTTLATSAAWVAAIVNQLYLDTLGRVGDAGGVAHWSKLIADGTLTVAQVAANFYASPEYYNGIGGGTASSWISDLYVKILHRAADAGGLAYWAGQIASTGRVSVAYRFFQSSESAHTRVAGLYATLLGRGPDPSGWDYWAGQVVTSGDIALAVNLASSAEYANRAQLRYP
ncbi:MAG: hypothetical protein JWN46_2919 [Acidimicrobiales bacterium]|nr:hypothetical protein [Acidimicrobiales bacterium]